MNAREAAFLSLQKFERDGKYSNIELSASIEKYGLSGVERAFYTALFYGVTERKITLDYIISKFSSRPEKEIDRDVKTAIYIGLYQLFFMDKVPDSAAVNESVSLLTRFCARKNSEGFCNAVLRAAARGRDGLSYPEKEPDYRRYLSVKYSVPEWICEKWVRELGFEKAEAVLCAVNSHPKMSLCTNTLKTTREELIAKLNSEGIPCECSVLTPRGIRLTENVPYEKLSAFDEYFFVQDEASQLCGEAFDAQPGESILDACACPGGKSFYSALKMENRGEIVACDIHKNKLGLVFSGAKRLGIEIIETKVCDAMEYCEELPRFDRVLCDAPCSGLGVIAKKPEIRYKSEEETGKLPRIQRAILDNCAEYVRDGGVLLYSTCTVSREENDDIISGFLASHPEFSLLPFTAGAISSDGTLSILPDEYPTDGFFIAKLQKRN